MANKPIPSSITDEVISKLVEEFAASHCMINWVNIGDIHKSKIGVSDVTIETKVWGFNADFSKLILKVIINGVSVNKVILSGKAGDGYLLAYPYKFISDYRRDQ